MSDSKRPAPAGKTARKARPGAPKVEEEEVLPPTVEETPFRADKKSVEPESEVDVYTLQLFFDTEEAVFRAGFLEFPELRVADESRKEAIYAAEDKLHSHLAALRQSGKPVPEPIRTREYPSTLEVEVSQTLYRKLETRRLQERVTMDQMVSEMLTSAVDRKAESPQLGGDRNHRDHRRPQGKGRGGSQGRGGRGGYQSMDNRENFMEYVRNLEKGGGPPGYKKR